MKLNGHPAPETISTVGHATDDRQGLGSCCLVIASLCAAIATGYFFGAGYGWAAAGVAFAGIGVWQFAFGGK